MLSQATLEGVIYFSDVVGKGLWMDHTYAVMGGSQQFRF